MRKSKTAVSLEKVALKTARKVFMDVLKSKFSAIKKIQAFFTCVTVRFLMVLVAAGSGHDALVKQEKLEMAWMLTRNFPDGLGPISIVVGSEQQMVKNTVAKFIRPFPQLVYRGIIRTTDCLYARISRHKITIIRTPKSYTKRESRGEQCYMKSK